MLDSNCVGRAEGAHCQIGLDLTLSLRSKLHCPVHFGTPCTYLLNFRGIESYIDGQVSKYPVVKD